MTNERIYAWLGRWRDKMPPEAVAALQDTMGPLSRPSGEAVDNVASERQDSFVHVAGDPMGNFRKMLLGTAYNYENFAIDYGWLSDAVGIRVGGILREFVRDFDKAVSLSASTHPAPQVGEQDWCPTHGGLRPKGTPCIGCEPAAPTVATPGLSTASVSGLPVAPQSSGVDYEAVIRDLLDGPDDYGVRCDRARAYLALRRSDGSVRGLVGRMDGYIAGCEVIANDEGRNDFMRNEAQAKSIATRYWRAELERALKGQDK